MAGFRRQSGRIVYAGPGITVGSYVYETDESILFQAPTKDVGRIRIGGSEADDMFTLDYRGGEIVPLPDFTLR